MTDQAVPSHSRHSTRVAPREGEDGLFTQSWFPICQAVEVGNGEIRGFDFLDGRVIVVRTLDGSVRVQSAYCPHMGADLSVGTLIDGRVRCAFHHWEYGGDGRCARTAIGDPPPAAARLFNFPTRERFGLIWAFNGEQPLWELPDFRFPDQELVMRTTILEPAMPIDPWMQCANTPDLQHIRTLHGVTFRSEDPSEEIEWSPFGLRYHFEAKHRQGEKAEFWVGINGTSLYWQEAVFEGKWFGFLAPFSLPRPSVTQTFMVLAVRRDLGSEREVQQALDFFYELEKGVVSEDFLVMKGIRFRAGTLTRSDRALARFFSYMRAYPRAHPSRAAIS